MIDQNLFNILISACGALGGWLLKAVWDGLKDLQAADQALVSRLSAMEVLVAGHYVTEAKFQRLSDALFSKLDRIEAKLDGKMDK